MSDGLRQGWYDSSMVWKDRTSRWTSRWTPRGIPGGTTGLQGEHEGVLQGVQICLISMSQVLGMVQGPKGHLSSTLMKVKLVLLDYFGR